MRKSLPCDNSTARRGSPARGCSPALLSAAGSGWFRNTTSPYLSSQSRWEHTILGVHTAFSYNCSVSRPREQFSQGKLCQGSLGSTASSNPYSASPTRQINLCWASPIPITTYHRNKITFSVQAMPDFWFFFFFFFFCSQAAQFPSSASPLISLSWLWGFNTLCNLHSLVPCFSPFHSEDLTFVPLSVSSVHCTTSWYCPKRLQADVKQFGSTHCKIVLKEIDKY